jgi:hypothetical protein
MKRTSASILAAACYLLAASNAQELSLQDASRPPSERRAMGVLDEPPAGYTTPPFADPVSVLNEQLAQGSKRLHFDEDTGYLKSVLAALGLNTSSQLLVYSKTSIQAQRISPGNPRALYFSDDVVVGYIRGAPFLEFAALDPHKGVQFYTLTQRDTAAPRIAHGSDCLRCHVSLASMDVPGLLLRSVPTFDNGQINPRLGNFTPDHRSPFSERWGGWYVTGELGRIEHMGNLLLKTTANPNLRITASNPAVASLEKRFDQQGYLTPFSDVVALMTFEHQQHMTNLLVRIGWDAQHALALPGTQENRRIITALLESSARELVDYLLFIDEAPLPNAIGTSAFARDFAARGPFDKQGRSLRQFDLKTRLMRYPCSYMIYSRAFDQLPDEARAAVYRRLWEVLTGTDQGAVAHKLKPADRKAVLEILRATKPGLPDYFVPTP